MNSHLLRGKVRHRRSRPTVYEFEHDVYYFALDLGELDQVASRLRLVSRNRRNVYSFRDSDHLLPPAEDVRAAVWDHLRAEGFDPDGWRVTLVTSLRVLGYEFNPASFYLCRNRAGELEVVVVEVHNTYHERHVYTLRPALTPAAHVASMDKGFYVSPFIDLDASYTVRVRDRPDGLRIVIDETEHGLPLLQASMVLQRVPLRDRTLLRLFARHPLVPHKTTGMILWHALRLRLMGVRFHRHGEVAR